MKKRPIDKTTLELLVVAFESIDPELAAVGREILEGKDRQIVPRRPQKKRGPKTSAGLERARIFRLAYVLAPTGKKEAAAVKAVHDANPDWSELSAETLRREALKYRDRILF